MRDDRACQRPRRSGRGASTALTRRGSRLAASLAALALALSLLVGVGVAGAVAGGDDEGPLRSSDASTLGIFVENGMTPEEMESAGLQGNDSNLGIFVTAALGRDLTVKFYSQGVPAHQDVMVGYGGVVRCPTDPAWNWDLADASIDRDAPVSFEGWCVEDAPGSLEPGAAYDFATPVTKDLVLVAAWGIGEPVDVTLHAQGGELEGADDGGTLVIQRYPGSPYRTLPTPTMAGHAFAGWSTEERDPDLSHVVDATSVVPAEGDELFAQWEANTFWVRYVSNPDMAGGGAQLEDKPVAYGSGAQALAWDAAAAEDGGFYVPAGKVFDGWDVRVDGSDGSGKRFWPGDDVSRLTDAVEHVPLYAQWIDDESLKGPFEVTFDFGHDGKVVTQVVENRGDKVDDPDGELRAPKRAGYQFAGWFTDEGSAWSLDFPVLTSLTLHARWDLRLDVTVPVAVGFAVDAGTKAVTVPEAGAYAFKSRTVVPVEVERFELVSEQAELEGFFELAAGADGWEAALADTTLSLRSEHAAKAIELPLAGAGDAGAAWSGAHELTNDERAVWRLGAFSYAGTAFDESWEGADPSERMGIELGMAISEQLSVRNNIAGAVPITHLKVTVVARG